MAINFNLKGLLQDEEFLVAAGLLSAGAKGQSLGQAAFPALVQAGQLKKAFEPLRGKKISPSAGDKLIKIIKII